MCIIRCVPAASHVDVTSPDLTWSAPDVAFPDEG